MKKGKMVKAQPMPNLNSEFSMQTLGLAIRSKRTQRGYRIDDLAMKANISRNSIMKIEKGDANVTFANVMLLMDILGLSFRLVDLAYAIKSDNTETVNVPSEINEEGWYE